MNFLRGNHIAKELANLRTSPRFASIVDNFFGDGNFLRISFDGDSGCLRKRREAEFRVGHGDLEWIYKKGVELEGGRTLGGSTVATTGI